MYFHTDNPTVVDNLAEALSFASVNDKRVRFDVDGAGTLKVKIGEGIWSAPIESDPDPYRDQSSRARGMKWFVNEEGTPYDYPAEYQAEVFPNDFHTPFDTEEEAEAFALGLEARR